MNSSFSNNYFNIFSIGRSDILTGGSGSYYSDFLQNKIVFAYGNPQQNIINVFAGASENAIATSSTFDN